MAVMLLVAAGLLLLLVQVRRPRRYAIETLWRAPLGQGGVATAVGADGRTYGPLAFAAGREQVVLADSFDRRLLFVPAAGGAARAVSLGRDGPLVEDLALAPDGTLYLADRGGTLWRLPPGARQAEPVERFGDGAGLVLVEGVAVLPGGDPVVDLLTLDRRQAVRSVFVLLPGGRRRPIVRLTLDEAHFEQFSQAPFAAVPAGGHALAAGPAGGIYLLGLTAAGRRAVFRFGADGGRRSVTPLPERQGRWSLLGVDRSGQLYLGVNLGRPDGEILRVGRRGRLTLVRALSMDATVHLGVYARVSADGEVYVLDPGARELTLRHWRLMSGWRLAWRWAPSAGGPAGLPAGQQGFR